MELIKIQEHEGKKCVSAKELYLFLGYDKSHWVRWHKQYITENEFSIEGTDYIGFATLANGNPSTDYQLSIEFAKRIAMMAKTEKGEQIRKYFIECEKQISQPKELSRKELALMVIAIEEEKEMLQLEIEILKPKAEYTDLVLRAKNTWTTTSVASELNMSAVKLNKLLKDRNIQFKHKDHYILKHPYKENGYVDYKTYTYNDSFGNTITSKQMEWTEYGRLFIHGIINK